MNKAQLIERMAKSAKISKAACKKCLEGFIVMKRKARTGVNPATGKKMNIPAKKVAKFKAGKSLRDSVA
jgi:DNA-binding protein HU-beta